MNDLPIHRARVLIASGAADDADLARAALRGEFASVTLSVHPETAASDFEACRPEVVVLAFQDLAQAERYWLGLCSANGFVRSRPPRSVLLCRTVDVAAAYRLCKDRHFDDYAQFWPMSFDAYRLPMSVMHSVRAQRLARALEAAAEALIAQAQALTVGAGGPAVEPAAPPETAPALAPAMAPATAQPPAWSYVLLVEDDEFQQKVVSRMLVREHHEVQVAATGAAAIEAVMRRVPSLILLDYRLPDADGATVLRRLRALPQCQGIPIVMLTANGDRHIVMGCMQAGADDFIVKPVSADRLRESLGRYRPVAA